MGKKKRKTRFKLAMSKTAEKVGQEMDVQWFDADNVSADQPEGNLMALPETPDKCPPLKRPKAEVINRTAVSSTEASEILFEIKRLSEKIDHTFAKVTAIGKSSERSSLKLTELASTVQKLALNVQDHDKKIGSMELQIARLKDETSTLKASLADAHRYTRKWSLKLHGLKEEEREDVRALTIDVLHKVAPSGHARLEVAIDVAHRVGRKKLGTKSQRSIIILFSMRRYRDLIWKEAKNNAYLQNNNLRISEALSPEDQAAREALWPSGEKGIIPRTICIRRRENN